MEACPWCAMPDAGPCVPRGGRAVNEMRRLPAQGGAMPAATRRRHVHAAPRLRIPSGQRLSNQAPVFLGVLGVALFGLARTSVFHVPIRRMAGGSAPSLP